MFDHQGTAGHDRPVSRRFLYAAAGIWILLFLSSCTPAPPEHQVRDAISAYFTAGGLTVVRLEIRSIEREPIGARQYMGPRRFIVRVPVITLRSADQDDRPADYRDVTITVRENKASLYGFSVDATDIVPYQWDIKKE